MKALAVPLIVDTISIDHGRHVVGALTNFDTLPWFDGTRDRFPTTPNVASAVATEPFADHDLWLVPGVHVHWKVPAGLARGSTVTTPGSVDVDGLFMPPVPNRWFVVRRCGQELAGWVVESDYVHPDGASPGTGVQRPIAYPSADVAGGRPYVRLGRCTPVAGGSWTEHAADLPDRFLPGFDQPLTALGHGDPTFAALYGNCHSVFGFHDPAPAAQETQYFVLGWYSSDDLDPLSWFHDTVVAAMPDSEVIERVNRIVGATHRTDVLSREALERILAGNLSEVTLLPADADVTPEMRARAAMQAMDERFGWTFDLGESRVVAVEAVDSSSEPGDDSSGAATEVSVQPPDFPSATVCIGAVNIDPKRTNPATDSTGLVVAPVAVGTSTAEALAAMVADDTHPDPGDAALRHELEAELVALELCELHADAALDLPGSFAERRHSLMFSEHDRRTVWTVRHGRADVAPGGAAEAIALSSELAHELNVLNELQETFDRAGDTGDALRHTLFEDWHRYMIAAYPVDDLEAIDLDLEALVDVIEADLAEIAAHDQRVGDLTFERDAVSGRWMVSGGADGTVASRLAEQLAKVSQGLDDASVEGRPPLELGRAPGSRFFRPADPVVLFKHTDLDPDREAGDAPIPEHSGACSVRDFDRPEVIADMPATIGDDAQAWIETVGFADVFEALERSGSVRTQGTGSWNPLLLEWEAEVRSLADGGNHDGAHRGYDPSFVTDHHHLAETSPHLTAADPAAERVASFEYVSGRTTLSGHAVELMIERVRQAFPPGANSGTPAASQRVQDAVGMMAGPVYQGVLSQALDGFGDTLVMRRREAQLTVADPLGFGPQTDLADRVRAAVDGIHPSTPIPSAPFHPIQSGELRLQRLRIIDTFGQSVEWRPERLVPSEAFRAPATNGRQPVDHVRLPLRVSQAARLNVRWWSAGHDDVESNDHPATSPVCGWFLPNELDGEVHVYDAGGRMIGFVDVDARWQPAPGSTQPITHPAGIPDAQLRRAVAWLTIDRDGGLLTAFLGMIDAALDAIDPLDHVQHSSRALLIGRPVALVRASVGFELHGAPMTDLSWPALRRRLIAFDDPTTAIGDDVIDGGDDHGLTAVRFPVRVGEQERLGDGLVGYWLQDADGTLSDSLTAPHSLDDDTPTDARIVTIPAGAEHPPVLELTMNGPEQMLLMLVDPRGSVHATSGILPVERLSIPIEQYAPALASMRATFRAMPVLTPADQVALPLPAEPGLSWAWLQRRGRAWLEVPERPMVFAASFVAAVPSDADDVWNDFVERGIIELIDSEPERGWLNLNAPGATLTAEELRLLNSIAVGIAPAGLHAAFGTPTVIREGWLQLKPTTSEVDR